MVFRDLRAAANDGFVAGHGWQGGQDHQDHSEREPQ
jgi:hypothetical protein